MQRDISFFSNHSWSSAVHLSFPSIKHRAPTRFMTTNSTEKFLDVLMTSSEGTICLMVNNLFKGIYLLIVKYLLNLTQIIKHCKYSPYGMSPERLFIVNKTCPDMWCKTVPNAVQAEDILNLNKVP